ncbi:MAG: AAA family ATPase [Actinobacteria bacterium]|nr:AAA family ATPase [Actinomycetota bacterium]
MRIAGWRVDAFGPLRDWAVADLAQAGIVVVVGDNETGKSALFEFLAAALFGFVPTTADQHPYTPWEGGSPGGRCDVVLANGSRVGVARRLTSRAAGTLDAGQSPSDLANRPVPWVSGLPRAMFRSIHALTQEEALEVRPETWAHVQDRLFGGASYAFLRPAREAVEELEQGASDLWRPDRRGKPQAAALRARIRDLRGELGPAAERRARILAIDQELRDTEARLHEMEHGPAGLQEIDVRLERADAVQPVVARMEAIRVLEATAARVLPEDELPADPRMEERDLARDLGAAGGRVAGLAAEVAKRKAAMELDDPTRALLAQRDPIERLHLETRLHLEDVERVGRMDRAIQTADGQIAELAARVLAGGVDDAARSALRGLGVAEFRGRFERWAEAWQVRDDAAAAAERAHHELGRAQAALEAGRGARGVVGRRGAWGLIVGLALVVAGLLVGGPVGSACLALGALAAGLGAGVVWFARSQRGVLVQACAAAERVHAEAGTALQRADTRAAAAREALRAALGGLTVAPVRLERPVATFATDSETLHAAVVEQDGIAEDRREVTARIEARDTALGGVRAALALELTGDLVAHVRVLHDRLQGALERANGAERAAAELPDLRNRLGTEEKARDGAQLRLDSLRARLAALDREGADAERGLDILEQARDARRRAVERRADLERETPEWKARLAEGERLAAAGVVLALSSEERAALRRRRQDLAGRTAELQQDLGRLGEERQRLLGEPGPAHIQGDIEAAEAELDDVWRAHDRLVVLAAAIREAERRYRERFQSPLLVAATAHLQRITHQRYDLLAVDDTDPSGARLLVRRRGADFPIPVGRPLSRGALQQIYLALRLALVDQVETGEPLPLFLDEMFVNWDPGRAAGGVAILADLAPMRQVFLFTADPTWAQRVADQAGARIVPTPVLTDWAGLHPR